MLLHDRSDLNQRLSLTNFFPPFFSVLLPELGRPQYLKECVESIHRHADMPIEVIVHDDGSGKEKQRALFEDVYSKVSTFVFTTGHNTGLARAFNRCRAMASSDYLIGFNTDTYMTSSFLRRMKSALDLPYVGVVNVVRSLEEGPGVHITPDGTKVGLYPQGCSFHCCGIRAGVWDAAGGWDENVQTTSSDVGFLGSVWGLGLFPVVVEGTVVNEMWQRSTDGLVNCGDGNPNYVAASEFTRGDNNAPPIFGIPVDTHNAICEHRRDRIWHGVNDFILKDSQHPSWYNSNFSVKCLREVMPNSRTIDWEAAKKFGHDKWKDRMIADFHIG